MKNKKLFILVFSLLFLLSFLNAYAQNTCSKSGYTVLTINGIFTDQNGAQTNALALKRKLITPYNNEPITVDYVYNPSHLAGVGDLIDSVKQGLFNQKSDYDLTEMLNDASEKVGTRKILLVGHSQGNFYANNFYDKVADIEGGVPKGSIGVYAIATPANRVAGGGKYITSDTDKVIADVVRSVKNNTLRPNEHIVLDSNSSLGHDFSDVYLRYRGNKIVADIKSSFDKLKTNEIQSAQGPCLSPQKISLGHKITGVILKVTDAVVGSAAKIVSTTYNLAYKFTNTISKIAGKSLALVGFPNGPTSSLNEVGQSSNNNSQTLIETTTISKENVNVNTGKNLNTNTIPVVVGQNNSPSTVAFNTQDVVNNTQTPYFNVISGVSSHKNKNSNPNPINDNSDTPDPIPDTTAPAITLVGENIININLNETYSDAGAHAYDNIDGVIAVTITGFVDTTKVGAYIITYTATDKAGNTSTLNRTVNVNAIITPPDPVPTPDTIAPLITLVGENSIKININTTYVDAGANALDITDGVVKVVTTGTVNTAIVGIYTLTYTATDKAGNFSTLTRTVEVLNIVIPPDPTGAYFSLPPEDLLTAGDGIYPNTAKKNIEPFSFQVVYTNPLNVKPFEIYVTAKNINTGVSTYVTLYQKASYTGHSELNDDNYANGEIYAGATMFSQEGDYNYYFIARDEENNYIYLGKNDNLKFTVIPSLSYYQAKYSFGTENGDANNWQVWIFNGSNVYDWSDTYVNGYLREQFKMQTSFLVCSSCLQRGIFKSDPREGFEPKGGVVLSGIEGSAQNSQSGKLYLIDIQWDPTGYTINITTGGTLYLNKHVNVKDMNNNLWVGWDTIFNGFTKFPSGDWIGLPFIKLPEGMTGGYEMVIEPFPVYKEESVPAPTPVLSSEKLITSYNFESLIPKVNGVIDNTNNTINLIVPFGTKLTDLIPTVAVSDKSSVLPLGSIQQDFTNPVVYTVTAEDGTTSSYTVTVVVTPEIKIDPPDETPPSDILPVVTSYTLNESQSDITINPKVNNLSINLIANKDVIWKSIGIEKENTTPSVYKTFSDGKGCVNGTSTCEKTWIGNLSSDGPLQNGNYKIKVHIEDTLGKKYEEYLPSVITVIGQ